MKTKLNVMLATLAVAMLANSNSLQADQVTLDVSPANKLLQAGKKQTTWVRVGVTGFEMEKEKERPPVNIAIVLDKSGSMGGQKIAKAREAAMGAIDRLGPNDIITVITYDTTVNILVPATKLTDKEYVKKAISHVNSGGGTALFAGVSKGAAEIRKFLDKERVNRIILLSDGLANEGPSSPSELGALGASLKKEGISVSTLGLGLDYNEDLMAQLADKSGGNHQFIERATELADIFNREFDDVTSVVAQEVSIEITVPEGIRPVRVLGADSEIAGQNIQLLFSQIYSKQNRHVVVELEVPESKDGKKLQLAKVAANYQNMQSGKTDKLNGEASIKFSKDAAKVEASTDKDVMENVIVFIANEQNRLATDFLDAGDLMKCASTLELTNDFLELQADKLDSVILRRVIISNTAQVEAVKSGDLNRARKDMRYIQNSIKLNAPSVQSKLEAPPSAPPAPAPSQR
ncbi:MAG: VWA domain-containing protein [Planctomicrobium sp.]|jgi:Ca-activated chloride channel homolog|nr:VWA domain-containing protein [Planctomicrobium sp.]